MADEPAPVVLHVNDEEAYRHVVTRMLRDGGFDVLEAANGETALDLALTSHPDLVIADVRLPGIDGFEVCRRLKAHPATASTPVVLFSAYLIDERPKVVGLEGGADAYLTGPLNSGVLNATVRALLRARRAERTAGQAETRHRAPPDVGESAAESLRLALNAPGVETFAWPIAPAGPDETPRAIAARSLFERLRLAHPDDRERVLEAFERALTGGGAYQCEHRQVRADGSVVWVVDRGRVVFDATGTPARLVGVGVDVTAQKREEERLRMAVEAAPSAMVMVDERGRIVFVNAGAEKLFGYERGELLGRSIEQLLPERFREGHRAFRDGFRADPRTRPMGAGRDLYARRKDGGEVAVEIGLNPVRTDAGLLVLAGILDITERKRAEQSIRESEERLRLALEAGRMGTWEWRIETGRFQWSPTLEAMHGLPPGSFGGTYQAFEAAVHPDDVAAVRGAVATALDGGDEYRVEYRIVRPDGTVRWMEARGRLFHDAQGRPDRMLGICMDVTERRHVEEERQALLGRERAARDEAEAANRAKDEFLALLSHELRTPLTAILGWARVALARQLDRATLDRAVQTIERNAKLQARLIDDLLDVSRIIAGKLRLERRPTSLRPVVEAALEGVRPTAQTRGVHLDTGFFADADLVSGDASRLQQVVWNLLANAVKFTPAGGRVAVRLERRATEVVLTVSDTGQGIRAELLPHVFDRFRQADTAVGSPYGGLGLGLAIVRHLVELHGGTVTAASAGEGRGATFTVALPLLPEEAVPAAAEIAPAVTGRYDFEATPTLDGVRVLVVEDERDSRDLLSSVLALRGADVLSVGSAGEALAVLGRFRPDVVVSDIRMAGKDGYALVRELRARSRHVRALALTAFVAAQDREQALAAGFHAHLAKPVDPGELIAAVAGLAGRRSG